MAKKKPAQTARPDPRRAALAKVLAEMPEEAYGWFVAWAMQGFPSGLGGFKPESRASIEALRKAAARYAGT